MKRLCLIILILSSTANASTLPGFHVQLLHGVPGFVTALATDSRGTLYYAVKSGDIFRFGFPDALVAHVDTVAEGNSGLIGLALRDDHTAIVHYTTARQTYDVVSTVDLSNGVKTELHRFLCDITPGGELRGVSTEHHGGNIFAAKDGSVFLGIGDYNEPLLAPDLAWNAGKIWRIRPDGSVVQFARGFRNPFDLAWDATTQRVVLTDNGDFVDDEINVVAEGDDCGWPRTAGNEPTVAGTRAPVYVFPTVVAPTGLAPLSGANPILRRGYLLGSFVTRSLYYVPDVNALPVPDPMAVIQGESDPIIDVIEAPDGTIYFASGFGIYKLNVPKRGDCNGDGTVNAADLGTLASIVAAGPRPMTAAQNGPVRGTWGCDANGDGLIDNQDIVALAGMVRGRAVRR
jgi:hypothetical protein